jgi:hypothetical protein
MLWASVDMILKNDDVLINFFRLRDRQLSESIVCYFLDVIPFNLVIYTEPGGGMGADESFSLKRNWISLPSKLYQMINCS